MALGIVLVLGLPNPNLTFQITMTQCQKFKKILLSTKILSEALVVLFFRRRFFLVDIFSRT